MLCLHIFFWEILIIQSSQATLHSALSLGNLPKERDTYVASDFVALRNKNSVRVRVTRTGQDWRWRNGFMLTLNPGGSDLFDICEVQFNMLFMANGKPMSYHVLWSHVNKGEKCPPRSFEQVVWKLQNINLVEKSICLMVESLHCLRSWIWAYFSSF